MYEPREATLKHKNQPAGELPGAKEIPFFARYLARAPKVKTSVQAGSIKVPLDL